MVDKFVLVDQTTGSKTANTDWFVSDLTFDLASNKTSEVHMYIAVDKAARIEITLDGTNYMKLNGGANFAIDSLYEFTIDILQGDVFNIRSNINCSVTIGRVLIG